MSNEHGSVGGFSVGQVVLVHDPFGFGEITKILHGNEVEVSFWDFDKGDRWSWMYDIGALRPLTKKQRGNVRTEGR